MERLRFIHTADLHLDSPFKGLQQLPAPLLQRVNNSTFIALKRIVDLAIKEQVDFVLISGDLYDGEDRSLRAQSILKKELQRLQKNDISTYIIHGNHDHLNGNWARLDWPENVHFFGEEIEVKSFYKNKKLLASIYGFSYAKRAMYKNMVVNYEKQVKEGYHIAMLHGQLEGNEEHDSYAPFTVQQLLQKDFDYWALGHIHKQQQLSDSPAIIYPGNIQGRHPKELGDKGCLVVTLTETKTELHFQSTADIIWQEERISITNLLNEQQLIDRCEEMIEVYRQDEKGVFLKIIFEGQGGLHSFLNNYDQVQELLQTLMDGEEEKQAFVWPISVRVETQDHWDRESLKEEEHLIGDVIRLVDRSDKEIVTKAVADLYGHHLAKRYVQQLNEKECYELLKEAETLLLTELLKEKIE